MRVLFRCVAIMSTFLVAATTHSQAHGGASALAVNALPDRIWVAPDQTWPLSWQSAVSPSSAAQVGADDAPPADAPITCCAPGQPLKLRVSLPGQPDEAARIAVVRYRPLPAGVNPAINILTFGDSLSETYLPTVLRQSLEGLGYKPTMIGTTEGRAWNGLAERTEGRGGKLIRDLLYLRAYSPKDINTVQPVPIGGEAQYLALLPSGMSKVTRKYFNPFLRPASGSRFHGRIDGTRLTVTSMETGFVGLGQSLRMDAHPLDVRIIGFVRGKYGAGGDYLLDHPLPRHEGEIAGEECAACVNNDTVFDVRFYLSRFNLPDPDWVMLSAGTNDMFAVHPGAAGAESLTATVEDGVRSLHAAFRLALPDSRIVFYNVALGTGPIRATIEPMHRTLMAATRDTVRSLRDPRTYWVNAAIWQSEARGWWVHPEGEDMINEARALAALIAAEQNPAGHDIAR